MVSSAVKSGVCLGCGASFVVIGAVMAVFWPIIFFDRLKQMMILTNESMSFEVWQETPIPMYLECFLFNVSNVDEILAGNNVKPILVQMGPYVYRESHSKQNLSWNDNNTVTFYNERYWHFRPEMSNGSLSDEVTALNPVIASIAYRLRFSSRLVTVPVNLFLIAIQEHPFITANVSSWLFDGIDDPIMAIVGRFPDIDFGIPYDKFAWFYTRNGSLTFDGVFVMNTGAEDFSQLGNVEMWKHSNETVYEGSCGKVQGSTGELWAPELGQPEVAIFAPDICTYMLLSKNATKTVDGISGVTYASNSSLFDNGHNYPEMACYCDRDHPERCMPSGALNVSQCLYEAPAFVSLPHFYNADPIYVTNVVGLEPKPEYSFRLTLEMFTGIPLEVVAQLQINFLVQHVRGLSIVEKLADNLLMPMFWFRQELQITPEYASMAKFALNLRYGMMYGFYALTALGVILLMSGIVVLVRRLLVSPERTSILQGNTDEDSQ